MKNDLDSVQKELTLKVRQRISFYSHVVIVTTILFQITFFNVFIERVVDGQLTPEEKEKLSDYNWD